jgi:hypothetical protein
VIGLILELFRLFLANWNPTKNFLKKLRSKSIFFQLSAIS